MAICLLVSLLLWPEREGLGLTASPISNLRCSHPLMPLRPASVLLQTWGSLLCVYIGEEVQEESGRASHRRQVIPDQLCPATSTLPTASQTQDPWCLCQTFKAPSTQSFLLPAFLARPTAHPVSLPHGPSPIPLYSKLWNIYLQGYLPWPPRSPCVWSLSPYCVPCPILTTYIKSYHQQPWGRQMPTPFYRWRN